MPEIIEQDEMKIGQVLVNIISNAVKYTNSGQIRVSASLMSSEEDQKAPDFELSFGEDVRIAQFYI